MKTAQRNRNAALLAMAILGTAGVGGGAYTAIHAATHPVLEQAVADPSSTQAATPTTGPSASSQSGLIKVPPAATHSAPALPVARATATANPDDNDGADRRAAYTGDNSGSIRNVAATIRDANTEHAANASTSKVTTLHPNRVLIPSIGVLASVIPEKVSAGYLTIPAQSWRAAWYNQSAALNASTGNTVIAGHFSLGGTPGVFANLSKLNVGSLIYTSDGSGKTTAWRVATKNLYGKRALPDEVFYPATQRMLTLITCGGMMGTVAGPAGSYYGHEDNEVVQAVPVATN